MFKIAYDKRYKHPLPEGHKFPMEKYELIPEQLILEGTITENCFFSPDKVEVKDILAVHQAEYWNRLSNLQLSDREIRKTGFPHSKSLIERERVITGGTVQNALYALKYGVSANIAGGTHHAFTDRGEGFCLLNDIAVSASFLLRNAAKVSRVLVVDLDVHQGNGTAEIFKNDNRVFTFSMHGAGNYPLRKERSDLDVELKDGTEDGDYLKTLKNILPRLIDKVEPDFIFYQCGVDILKSDKLGRLGLTVYGCKERDRFVLEMCKKHEIPVAFNMGGGYSNRLHQIVEAHANTYRLAADIFF